MMSTAKIEHERDLVLFQLLSSDPKLRLSVGGSNGMQTYTRDQIIEHVTELDEIGQEYIDTQMNFMRALSNGELFDVLHENLG